MRRAAAALALLTLGASAPAAPPSPLATVTVQAKGETVAVGTANADAADDPAIWRNRRNPGASLVVATDKKAGLHVYDLTGADRSFLPAGRVNNVDLRDMGRAGIIVAASDRTDPAAAKLALFRLVPETAKLEPLARIDVGAGEAYGICLYREGRRLYAFNVLKDGTIAQAEIDLAGATPRARIVRRLKLATQSEGCVTDERRHRLYVGEEDVGVWRFDARATAATEPHRVAAADGQAIVADTEGLAIANGPAGRAYLVVSSQGDNAYAVYRLPDETYVGRFRVAAGRYGATEETDGIDLAIGNFGPRFPAGMLVIQDGHNEPQAQNFKLVDWRDVKRALGIR
jgi:3-phytase